MLLTTARYLVVPFRSGKEYKPFLATVEGTSIEVADMFRSRENGRRMMNEGFVLRQYTLIVKLNLVGADDDTFSPTDEALVARYEKEYGDRRSWSNTVGVVPMMERAGYCPFRNTYKLGTPNTFIRSRASASGPLPQS